MNPEQEQKIAPDEGNADAAEQNAKHEAYVPRGAQAQRDAEITAIREHSRYQPPTIQRPPELPPAPPRKALTIVGVSLLVLIIAGSINLIGRTAHERALAKETEQETV